mgnify:CR=1 FL=1
MFRSSARKEFKKKLNKSVDPSLFVSTKINTDKSKVSFVEVCNTTAKDNMYTSYNKVSSLISEFHYN